MKNTSSGNLVPRVQIKTLGTKLVCRLQRVLCKQKSEDQYSFLIEDAPLHYYKC
jgi:hypothetical protein